ncbi:MAG: hypothetical protein HS132_12900 [Planctomycetia bacterium]|nr:hypothetical protein [Planctomycetia bacterium]
MARNDEWTAGWTAEKLHGHSEVLSTEPITGNALKIKTKKSKGLILIATLSVDTVRKDDFAEVYLSKDVVFAMNVPKNAVYYKSAIRFAENKSFGIGGLSDLFAALNGNSYRQYLSKETRFVLRGLEQHTKVSSVNRITNRLYEVSRHGLEPIRILALNEYDLTADAVRSGIENHGKCSIILTSNPNCRPSDESIRAADSAGAKVLKWGEMLGALNYAK